MHNPNKIVTASSNAVLITYTDNHKSVRIPYERLQSVQLYGNKFKEKTYQSLDTKDFNSKQQFMYRTALYGLGVYDQREIDNMPFKQRFIIMKHQNKAQKALNRFKNEIMNMQISKMLPNWFSNSTLAKEFVDEQYDDLDMPNVLSFKDLGINKFMIAKKLMSVGILPANFFQIAA